MAPFGRDEEEEDPTYDTVVSMADRLGLKGKGRINYIDDHMTQLGYEAVQSRESYVRVHQEEADDEGAGNRWGFGGRAGGSNRESGKSRSRPNRDTGDSF